VFCVQPFPWGNKSLLHNPHTNLGEPEVEEEAKPEKKWVSEDEGLGGARRHFMSH